ncbi:MAG TPA: vitamin K epoxide reductase family protein [Flavisolibacter sp.]|nr:vitamin K epoxide reductase family protein [Flavisolibacter sp.]
MDGVAKRNDWRSGQAEELNKRRKLLGLSAMGLLDFAILSLYQTGIIKKLPDIPLPLFGANKVSASKEAFLLGPPDGPIASTLYSLLMVLTTAGSSKPTGHNPLLDKLLTGAISVSAAMSLLYFYAMAKNKKICLYCLTGAVINFTMAAIQLAPKRLRSNRKKRLDQHHLVL